MLLRSRRVWWSMTCLAVAIGISSAGSLSAAAPHAVADHVAAHIAAGEFGPAIDLALSLKPGSEQTTLLTQIAAAQTNAGEEKGAAATLRRIPNRRDRNMALSQQPALAGGGAMANPGPLMNLIQRNTGGPDSWAEDQDGVGGTMSWFQTGVRVSPLGVLERITAKEHNQTLANLGIQARKADLNADLAQPSSLRLVSLTRLDRELTEHLANGRPVPTSMALLAGLTKVQYVFLFPEDNEIVIGGPAEGWDYNAQGLALGRETNSPTLLLDDFVTVFRTFAGGNQDFGCSINTRDQNVASLQKYVAASQARGPLAAGGGVKSFVNQIQKHLGRQDIVVWGVPADSRVSRVIVEADYRMKLIGVDKLDAGKEIPSYFDLLPQDLQKNPAPMEALRWWLTMNYDAVTHSADKSVFEIQGPSVLCMSENQLLTEDGKHVPTGKSEGINRMFAENFTRNYAKLAERDPIFADARNVFDLALASALICKQTNAETPAGPFQAFSSGGLYQPASYAVPKEVESVVNHRVYNGRDVVVQAAGGVRVNGTEIAGSDQLVKADPKLDGLSDKAQRRELPAGRWWWDVSR